MLRSDLAILEFRASSLSISLITVKPRKTLLEAASVSGQVEAMAWALAVVNEGTASGGGGGGGWCVVGIGAEARAACRAVGRTTASANW